MAPVASEAIFQRYVTPDVYRAAQQGTVLPSADALNLKNGYLTAFLLAAGSPFLRVQQSVPGAEVLPAGLESRDTYVAVQSEFPRGEITPITILADVQGDPTSPTNAAFTNDLCYIHIHAHDFAGATASIPQRAETVARA